METIGDASLQRHLLLCFRSCKPNVSNYQVEKLYIEHVCVSNRGACRYERKKSAQ